MWVSILLACRVNGWSKRKGFVCCVGMSWIEWWCSSSLGQLSGRWVETDPQAMIAIHSLQRRTLLLSLNFLTESCGSLGSWVWDGVESMCIRKRACRSELNYLARAHKVWPWLDHEQASWALPFHLTFFFFKYFPNQAPSFIYLF